MVEGHRGHARLTLDAQRAVSVVGHLGSSRPYGASQVTDLGGVRPHSMPWVTPPVRIEQALETAIASARSRSMAATVWQAERPPKRMHTSHSTWLSESVA